MLDRNQNHDLTHAESTTMAQQLGAVCVPSTGDGEGHIETGGTSVVGGAAVADAFTVYIDKEIENMQKRKDVNVVIIIVMKLIFAIIVQFQCHAETSGSPVKMANLLNATRLHSPVLLSIGRDAHCTAVPFISKPVTMIWSVSLNCKLLSLVGQLLDRKLKPGMLKLMTYGNPSTCHSMK